MSTPERPATWLSRFLNWIAGDGRAPAERECKERVKSRPIMDRVLKESVLPELRARGFTGSYPHLRRIQADCIDLLTFQFSRYGGEFVVELAQCGREGYRTASGDDIPPDKVTAHHLFGRDRFRLSAGRVWRRQWFVFDDTRSAESEVAIEANCRKAAKAALEAFARQAETWWSQRARRGAEPDAHM